jgi:hypothetical protein
MRIAPGTRPKETTRMETILKLILKKQDLHAGWIKLAKNKEQLHVLRNEVQIPKFL